MGGREHEGVRETVLSCFPKRERGREGCSEERVGQSYGARLNAGTTSVLQMWPPQLSDTRRKKKRKKKEEVFRSEGKLVLNSFIVHDYTLYRLQCTVLGSTS